MTDREKLIEELREGTRQLSEQRYGRVFDLLTRASDALEQGEKDAEDLRQEIETMKEAVDDLLKNPLPPEKCDWCGRYMRRDGSNTHHHTVYGFMDIDHVEAVCHSCWEKYLKPEAALRAAMEEE